MTFQDMFPEVFTNTHSVVEISMNSEKHILVMEISIFEDFRVY